METKHTPGPWSLRDWATHDRDGAIEACGYEVVDANGHAVSAGVVEGASESEEANARLIAAAPDLLEALKAFAELAELFDDQNRGGNMPSTGQFMSWPRLHKEYELTVEHLRAARAAIAKATGAA